MTLNCYTYVYVYVYRCVREPRTEFHIDKHDESQTERDRQRKTEVEIDERQHDGFIGS